MKPEGSLTQSQVSVTCAYPQPARSSPCLHTNSWRSILILSPYICLGLSSGLFPSGFPTKTLHKPLPSPRCATCLVYLIFLTQTVLGEEYRSLSSSLYSFFHSPVTSSLRPKYSPQHPQPTYLLQPERSSFTPIQNNRQNYISVYLNL
jgi:hypothetical protein